jgi:hypothetical protein
MKNLVLTALVLGAASLAAGCTATTAGTVSASWDLQDWDDANAVAISADCPTGADTAIVYSLPAGLTNPADAAKDLFDCAAFGGTTAGLDPGTYTVWVEITDHSTNTLYAQSDSRTVSVSDGSDSGADFAFQVNRGYVSGAWTLVGAQSGSAITCDDAGVPDVEFLSQPSIGGLPIRDLFTCNDGEGTSYPLPVDSYPTVSVQAVDASGDPNNPVGLGEAAVTNNVDVQFGNDLQDLGTVTVNVDGV